MSALVTHMGPVVGLSLIVVAIVTVRFLQERKNRSGRNETGDETTSTLPIRTLWRARRIAADINPGMVNIVRIESGKCR